MSLPLLVLFFLTLQILLSWPHLFKQAQNLLFHRALADSYNSH
jgi:hypothetical protein